MARTLGVLSVLLHTCPGSSSCAHAHWHAHTCALNLWLLHTSTYKRTRVVCALDLAHAAAGRAAQGGLREAAVHPIPGAAHHYVWQVGLWLPRSRPARLAWEPPHCPTVFCVGATPLPRCPAVSCMGLTTPCLLQAPQCCARTLFARC